MEGDKYKRKRRKNKRETEEMKGGWAKKIDFSKGKLEKEGGATRTFYIYNVLF